MLQQPLELLAHQATAMRVEQMLVWMDCLVGDQQMRPADPSTIQSREHGAVRMQQAAVPLVAAMAPSIEP
jgi:hypothetical protein